MLNVYNDITTSENKWLKTYADWRKIVHYIQQCSVQTHSAVLNICYLCFIYAEYVFQWISPRDVREGFSTTAVGQRSLSLSLSRARSRALVSPAARFRSTASFSPNTHTHSQPCSSACQTWETSANSVYKATTRHPHTVSCATTSDWIHPCANPAHKTLAGRCVCMCEKRKSLTNLEIK